MALTALVPPSATNLLNPETVLTRMGLPIGNLDALTDIVEEASGLVARYLRFDPAYALWQETLTASRGERLYLGARPLWRVSGVENRDGTTLAATSFRVDTQRHCLTRYAGGWAYESAPPWTVIPPLPLNILSPTDAWDWSVEYEAGWWLESMAGSPPVGVGKLAPEVRRDFVAICRWLWSQESRDPTIRRMKDEGAEVEFFAAGDIDAETGIPCNLLLGLAQWRRPQ
jgi:hypothetical protein